MFPPGVTLIEDFPAPSEEQRLLSMIDSSDWSHDLGRRTQQYGYKFDYTTKIVVPMPPPPLTQSPQKLLPFLPVCAHSDCLVLETNASLMSMFQARASGLT